MTKILSKNFCIFYYRKISVLNKIAVNNNLKRDLKDIIMNTKFNRQGLINKFYEYYIFEKNFYFISEYFQVN